MKTAYTYIVKLNLKYHKQEKKHILLDRVYEFSFWKSRWARATIEYDKYIDIVLRAYSCLLASTQKIEKRLSTCS
jgi:hypothetical protein